MKFVALALLACALLSLSNAQCFQRIIKSDATHCQDEVDGTWHAVGSSWRNSQCMNCDCSGCCSAYSTPVRFPDDCESVLDYATCQYIVHKKNDQNVLCPVYASVGK